jgi:hypothetical protein
MKETSYELRELCSKDIFPMFKIISKIGIKNFKQCFESEETKAAIEQLREGASEVDVAALGINITLEAGDVVLTNLPKCEKEVYMFLSNISGLKKEEIAELPMGTFAEMIVDVIKMDGFKDFIQAVSKLLK